MPIDQDITVFAKTNFRNREVPFGIRRDDRRRHVYIIGKTGMGKTTLIENMVIQDILNGHGVAFVDPHGDSVEKVLSYIPSSRINDVVYFNPADMDYPIAFNPLESVDPKYKHLVASGLMGVFTKIWAGVWSPRMEYILNNTILALLDSPGNTMMGIARMLVNKAYRKKIVDNIKDPVVKSFWVDEFANYNDKFRSEAVAPIQNKVGQFLSSAIIRNIVGQTKSSIDLRDIMDNQKIFLINLSKGRIGEDNSALLGAMLITKLQLAAMSRVDIPEEDRKDFYLYVDEFQNFATESFANILSEARKYRLNLIVAHQYIGQLVHDRNTVVRDAIFGNVGTMITFRVGADDAEFLEKEYEPTYTMNDLVNLTKFQIYLKLMINGVASNPFSATTLPPISQPTGNLEKVISVSRERYANRREIVETKINRWMGAEFHAEAAEAESQSVEEEFMQDNMRYSHPAPAPAPKPVVEKPREEKPAEKPQEPGPKPVAAVVPEKAAETRMVREPERRKPEEPRQTSHEPKFNDKPGFVQRFEKYEQQRPSQGPAPERRSLERRHDLDRRHDERRDIERRLQQTENHPNRRETDKPQKNQNPIWETVSKISQEKIKESADRTLSALNSIEKSLEHSIGKAETRMVVHPHAPASKKPERDEETEAPVHHGPGPNIQSFLTDHDNPVSKQGVIKPGEKVKF
ncbi:MAG: type IV secretion system DNA-binding domain-containing protein [Candidatus Saccharibacteria bacterium]